MPDKTNFTKILCNTSYASLRKEIGNLKSGCGTLGKLSPLTKKQLEMEESVKNLCY